MIKLGSFMMPLHPPEKDRTECFEEDIAFVEFADELGFTESWFGQHHSLGWGYYEVKLACMFSVPQAHRRT